MSKYTEIGELKSFDPDDMPPGWYSDSYTVSTQGGHGKIWQVKVGKNKFQYTISTNPVSKTTIQTYRPTEIYFKKHYVLTEEGWSYIYGLLVESKL